MTNDNNLPREFGKYHLIETIAAGGMAELYRAKLYGAGGFEKDLAIKKVLPQLVQDDSFVQMFMDEAMITVTLSHGNIVSVIDFGEMDGEYYLVMEYVDGVNLQILIKKSQEINTPVPVPITCYTVLNICRGLDYAHRKVGPEGKPLQIVHRDVSPQNILLSFEGEVKIVDFGIARAASRITSTQAGVVKGKVAYMSPEQMTGQGVDNRADIFAAGILLYEMLTNRRPFEGETPQETMAQISRGNFEKPNKLNKKVDKKLTAIVKKALERNPKKRYKTAGEMATALSDYLYRVGQHADAATLAAFIPKRLPDARPRTIPPTPIRAIRRKTDERNAAKVPAPPPELSAQVNQQEIESQPDHFPVPAQKPVDSAPGRDNSDAVVVNDGEAISFVDLGLPPEYEPENSRRPTDPEHPQTRPLPQTAKSAVPPSEKPSSMNAETHLLPKSEEPQSTGPEQVDPDLLSAATMLLTKQPDPAPAAKKTPEEKPAQQAATEHSKATLIGAPKTKEKPTEHPPAKNDVESTWMQTGEKTAAAGAVPAKEPQKPAAPEPPASDSEVMKAALAPKRTSTKVLMAAAGVVFVLAITLYIVLRPGDQPKAKEPAPTAERSGAAPVGEPQKDSMTAAASPKPAPSPPQEKPEPKEPEKVPTEAKKEPPPPPPKEKPALAPIKKPKEKKKISKKAATAKKKKKRRKKRRKPPPKPSPFKPPERIATVKPKPASSKTGTLRINSEPFAVVYKGKKRLGPTPQMHIKLPAGNHTLTLKNDALGITKRIRVRIEADKVHTVFVELRK
jgi:serine/threonine protein kinase